MIPFLSLHGHSLYLDPNTWSWVWQQSQLYLILTISQWALLCIQTWSALRIGTRFWVPSSPNPIHGLAQRMSSSVFAKGGEQQNSGPLGPWLPLAMWEGTCLSPPDLSLSWILHLLSIQQKALSISAALCFHPPDRSSFDTGGRWGPVEVPRVQRLLLGDRVSGDNG